MREIEASLKYIKGSVYKLNNVARLIRNLNVMNAEAQLTFCDKRIAIIVRKLLKSAVANAVNNFKIDKNNLVIAKVDTGKSFVLKRSMPRGRGRSSRIEKRYSNIRIVLVAKQNGEHRVKKIGSNNVK